MGSCGPPRSAHPSRPSGWRENLLSPYLWQTHFLISFVSCPGLSPQDPTFLSKRQTPRWDRLLFQAHRRPCAKLWVQKTHLSSSHLIKSSLSYVSFPEERWQRTSHTCAFRCQNLVQMAFPAECSPRQTWLARQEACSPSTTSATV